MSIKDLDANHARHDLSFSLNGTEFAIGGENSSQDPDNCIFIQDVQGLDTFDFHLLRQGVTIDLDPMVARVSSPTWKTARMQRSSAKA